MPHLVVVSAEGKLSTYEGLDYILTATPTHLINFLVRLSDDSLR